MNDSFIGSQIAGYRIERILGRGGMASIYFAWDTHHNRPVALKVMDERYRDIPAYISRFIQEAQTIVSWDHPNIVKVYDAGQETLAGQPGIYYYAMEFIRGLDLSQLLRQYLDASQLMPYNEVVRIGWAVAAALDYAHTRGIIHRDVKPSNVLISVDGRVLLSDFGLVMDVSRGTMGDTFGSPAYIAPEQARNSAQAVPQSDNYALGVMLYEMLTGTVPFHDSSPAALALKHLTEEPPRPRALNPRLSPSVEAVLLRALRKRPEDRYATGREMLTALEHAFGDELRRPEASQPLPASGTILVPARRDQNFNASAPAAAAAASAAPAYPGPVTEIRDAAAPGVSVSTGQPRIYTPGAATSVRQGPPPPYQPLPVDQPAAQPVRPRRFGGLGWGCLGALVLLGLLAVLLGAAFAANRQGLPLFPFLAPAADSSPSATPTTTPARITLTPPLTATPVPTFTPLPPTPVPTATAAATAAPTSAPTAASAPVYNFNLYHQKQDGIVLVNSSKESVPLAGLEFWVDNNPILTGDSFGISALPAGRCVAVWATGVKPRIPSAAHCQLAGNIVYGDPETRFWAQNLDIHYNGVLVATCKASQSHCQFDTRP